MDPDTAAKIGDAAIPLAEYAGIDREELAQFLMAVGTNLPLTDLEPFEDAILHQGGPSVLIRLQL